VVWLLSLIIRSTLVDWVGALFSKLPFSSGELQLPKYAGLKGELS